MKKIALSILTILPILLTSCSSKAEISCEDYFTYLDKITHNKDGDLLYNSDFHDKAYITIHSKPSVVITWSNEDFTVTRSIDDEVYVEIEVNYHNDAGYSYGEWTIKKAYYTFEEGTRLRYGVYDICDERIEAFASRVYSNDFKLNWWSECLSRGVLFNSDDAKKSKGNPTKLTFYRTFESPINVFFETSKFVKSDTYNGITDYYYLNKEKKEVQLRKQERYFFDEEAKITKNPYSIDIKSIDGSGYEFYMEHDKHGCITKQRIVHGKAEFCDDYSMETTIKYS